MLEQWETYDSVKCINNTAAEPATRQLENQADNLESSIIKKAKLYNKHKLQ